MNNAPAGGRESTCVWLAIFITLAFSVVAHFLHLPEALRDLLRPGASLPLAEGIMLLYLFWLLGLLWVAHRDWSKEQARQQSARVSVFSP